MPTDTRHTNVAPRRLSARVIEGLERVITAHGGLEKGGFKELVETRAIARELIAHINAMEFEQRERMGIDDNGSATHPNHAGGAGDSQRRTS